MFITKNSYPSIDDKCRFVAQYYGQKILRSIMPEQSGSLAKINPSHFSIVHLVMNSYLELKDIANITPEDLRVIEDLQYKNILEMFDGKLHLLPSNVADYLRSNGYALPYLNFSVEQLIEYMWIKIV